MTTFVTKDGGLTIPADGRWHLVTAHDRATGELRRRFPVGEEGTVRLEYQLAYKTELGQGGLSVKWMRMPGSNVTAANDWFLPHSLTETVRGVMRDLLPDGWLAKLEWLLPVRVKRHNISPGAHFVDARPGFRAVVLAVQVIGPVPITLDVRVVKVTTEADR